MNKRLYNPFLKTLLLKKKWFFFISRLLIPLFLMYKSFNFSALLKIFFLNFPDFEISAYIWLFFINPFLFYSIEIPFIIPTSLENNFVLMYFMISAHVYVLFVYMYICMYISPIFWFHFISIKMRWYFKNISFSKISEKFWKWYHQVWINISLFYYHLSVWLFCCIKKPAMLFSNWMRLFDSSGHK